MRRLFGSKGMASRKGLGKVHHVEVNQFWVQEKVGSGEVELKRVDGQSNLVDALTKYLDGDSIMKHMDGTGQFHAYGRHSIMPALAEGT